MREGIMLLVAAERKMLRTASRTLDEASANVSGAVKGSNWSLVEERLTECLSILCQAGYPMETLLRKAREGLVVPA